MHRFFLCPLRQVVSLRHAGAVDLRCGLVDSTKALYKWKDRSGPARTARTDPQWPGPRWPGPPGPARTIHVMLAASKEHRIFNDHKDNHFSGNRSSIALSVSNIDTVSQCFLHRTSQSFEC